MNIVALISYPFLPARTGGQKGIALFYKYFSRHQAVTCVATQKNDPRLADGYELLNILSDSPLRYINPVYFFRLRRILRSRKASHLIIEHPYYGWLGILLKKFCGVKLVLHSHNLEGNRWKSLGKWWWRLLWHYEKCSHRQADYNFFISDEDKAYAIKEFGLSADRCLTVSFGIEIPAAPSPEAREKSAVVLRSAHGLSRGIPLLFFNGAFKYPPNREALENLLYRVNPILQQESFAYLLLVCGIDIPEKYFSESFPSVRVIGFAEDLQHYLQGTDVFLNTVITGGGIKTKLVEALGYGLNAVSTESGSAGIDPLLCHGKLQVCADGNWAAFAERIMQNSAEKKIMPAAFYDQFYWGNITRRAAGFIAASAAGRVG